MSGSSDEDDPVMLQSRENKVWPLYASVLGHIFVLYSIFVGLRESQVIEIHSLS